MYALCIQVNRASSVYFSGSMGCLKPCNGYDVGLCRPLPVPPSKSVKIQV